MTFLLILAALFVAGVVLMKKSRDLSGWECVGFCLCAVSGLALVTSLLMLLILRGGQHENIVRMEAVRETLKVSRSTQLSDLERAAILKEVADWNAWLAAEKYWNEGFWDIYHIDDVMALEPLK